MVVGDEIIIIMMELRYLSPSLNYSIRSDRSALLDTGKMLHNCIGFMCWMMGCLLDTCMYIYIYVCMDHYHHGHHIWIYNKSNQSAWWFWYWYSLGRVLTHTIRCDTNEYATSIYCPSSFSLGYSFPAWNPYSHSYSVSHSICLFDSIISYTIFHTIPYHTILYHFHLTSP